MIALDLDQWQFAIMGKEPQYHDRSVSEGISSLDRGRMERFNGTFFDALRVRPIGPTMRGYLLLSFRGYQRFDQWLQLSYMPSKSLLHAIVELRWFSISWLSGGNHAHQTQRTVGTYGQCFVTTGSIAMKHGRNGVGVSISRCRNFHKNTRNFLLNCISLRKQIWIWKIRLCHIWNAVHIQLNIWHQFFICKNVVLLLNYIVSKIEKILPIGKSSKIKNKKTAITFGEECRIDGYKLNRIGQTQITFSDADSTIFKVMVPTN